MATTTTNTPITAADLQQLTPSELAALLLDPATASKVAVIDVRDSDHIGGHVAGSHWVPTSELDTRIPELVRLHRHKDQVVFHCMLSQQRGPASALKFMRAVQGAALKEEKVQQQGRQEGNLTWPRVYVLEGGFGVWASRYGEDARLTEGFVKDLWE